ncbi:MAG: AzlD domain-containing protein [Pseudomonadota bacterium]
MSAAELIALVLGMLAVTFSVRYVLLAFGDRIRLPPSALRALQFVPVAVLSAITVPMVLQPGGELVLSPTSPHLAAGLAAVALAAWRAPLVVVILGGMATFFAWRMLFA